MQVTRAKQMPEQVHSDRAGLRSVIQERTLLLDNANLELLCVVEGIIPPSHHLF